MCECDFTKDLFTNDGMVFFPDRGGRNIGGCHCKQIISTSKCICPRTEEFIASLPTLGEMLRYTPHPNPVLVEGQYYIPRVKCPICPP